jgi:hypothetical protein
MKGALVLSPPHQLMSLPIVGLPNDGNATSTKLLDELKAVAQDVACLQPAALSHRSPQFRDLLIQCFGVYPGGACRQSGGTACRRCGGE